MRQAAFSDYFLHLFIGTLTKHSARRPRVLRLSTISGWCMQTVLQFIYKGQVTVLPQKLGQLWLTAYTFRYLH